jgi:hypothetical protein
MKKLQNIHEAKIDSLDISLFEVVPSQTSPGDRRSLLAIQRAVARHFGKYRYLEIGSYLGGTLQPHLLDSRCDDIQSIDLRPDGSPDDREAGCSISYRDNSEQHMLALLRVIPGADTSKLTCHQCDASKLAAGRIAPTQFAFIDGEHTRQAVLSDFAFCRGILSPGGVIAFHDCHLIAPAIQEILSRLRDSGTEHLGVDLEGEVYAIFFDPKVLWSDEYLASYASKARRLVVRNAIKSRVPPFILKVVKRLKGSVLRN